MRSARAVCSFIVLSCAVLLMVLVTAQSNPVVYANQPIALPDADAQRLPPGVAAQLAAAKQKPYAYVAITNNDGTGKTVQVIDTTTDTVVADITVGTAPWGLSETPDGTEVYVANAEDSTVSVLNTSTNSVVATIPVDNDPVCLQVSPNGKYVYVGNSGGGSVSVIQTSTNTVVATIPVKNPEQIAISPDGATVFVSNLWLNDANTYGGVTVIDAMSNQVVTTIVLNDAIDGIAVAPDDASVYVTELTLNQIVQISTVTYKVVAQIAVGARPTAIVITPNGHAAYVTDSALFGGTPDVEEINLRRNRVIASVLVGTDPVALVLNAKGTTLYVTNQLSSTVSVINTLDNTVIATIPVGTGPDAIVMKPRVNTARQ